MIDYTTPPEHTFLSRRDVIRRYGWVKTKGYQTMAAPDFPTAISGVYRLDTLIGWENKQVAVRRDTPAPQSGVTADHAENAEQAEIIELPRRRRSRAPRKEAS